MSDSTLISVGDLLELVREILLRAGFSPDHALAVARTIVAGERDG